MTKIENWVAQLGSDNSTDAQAILISESQGYAKKNIAYVLASAMVDNHPSPDTVYRTISQLHCVARAIALSYLSKNVTVPLDLQQRALEDLLAMIDEQHALANETGLNNLLQITAERLPRDAMLHARQAYLDLSKILEEVQPKPEIIKKETLAIPKTDDLSIANDWAMCRVSFEHGEGVMATIMAVFSNDTHSQRIVIQSREKADADALLSKLKTAKFKETNKRTEREWLYYTFER